MKKIALLAFVLVLALSLVACGGNTAPDNSGNNNTNPPVSNSGGDTTPSGNNSDDLESKVDLVPLGQWADINDSGGLKQVRITNIIFDSAQTQPLIDEYNAKSTLFELASLEDEYPDFNSFIYEYEVKYSSDYEVTYTKNGGLYFSPVSFNVKKDESGWYTQDNTYIVGISAYDATDKTDKLDGQIKPGDTVGCKGFGFMIDQYKDEFYLSVSYKDPADGEYKDIFFAVK